MIDGTSTTDGIGTSGEEYHHPFVGVRDELVGTPADEIARKLPNLVDAVVEAAADDDTERLLIGVSFTHDHGPLDYELDRIVEAGGTRQRESLKEAVSRDHLYLRFAYPPDRQFTATALRAALLGAVEEAIRDREETKASRNEPPATDLSVPEALYRGFRGLF